MDVKKIGAYALTLIGLAATALLSGAPAKAQDPLEPQLAQENPAFLDYFQAPQNIVRALSGGFVAGLVPEPFLLPKPQPGVARVQSALPASYDLRTLNKLTPIRNQGSAGACWDFATIGSMESFLMPSESWDFSENNLKNLSGFDIPHDQGGNRAMSTAYLARWAGPVRESDDPYNPTSGVSPAGIPPVKHVQDIIFVPVRSSALDNDAIKQAVMTYGAVYTTYYHSNSYYNSSTASYYCSASTSANHAVCIVGWDDNYSASKFLTPPPGNGAFLIRNSWGTYWGLSGYFWMSYYDAVLGKTENAVFTAEPTSDYSVVYQYDPLGWVSSMGYGTTTAYFANIFTATTGDPIAAAGWYCPVANSTYTLSVYTDPSGGPINSMGPAATKTGTIDTAGYHTTKLDNPVPVSVGQRFSVVVKLTTPGYGSPIAIERPYSGYSSKAVASTGQSYVSSSGTSWSDLAASYANTNVCLKAFASGSGTPPTPGAMSVSPATGLSSTGNAGGPFSPTSQTFTLSNTGQSSINWTAAASQPWVTLSATSGVLAANSSTQVTVTVNSNAAALAAGSYSDTVTFTNTTNGTGNTSRPVALIVNSSTPTPGVLSVTPSTGLASSGLAGGPFSPSSAVYTLSNTGQSSINWTATNSQAWVSLSQTSGTLAAGASTQVTVSINSSASKLAAGSYADSIAFANTTNGAGNTSRAVNLKVSAVVPTGNYTAMAEPFSWIDPTSHNKLILGDDTISGLIYLPFTFTFYGKPYARLYVGSNGLIGFGYSGMYSSANTVLPTAYAPNAAIYPYWDNLNPAAGGYVSTGTVGTAPNRKFVVSWVNVPRGYSTTVKLSVQAILTEDSNDIVFQYLNVSPSGGYYGSGGSATIGIENETGTQALLYSYNRYGAVANNQAIRIGVR